MRQRSDSSFRSQADDIDRAKSVGVLQRVNNGQQFGVVKSGCETWACAWSPNCLYFAWSSGNRKVHLVPWNQSKQCLVSDDPYDTEGRPCDQPSRVLECGDNVWSLDIGTGHSYANRNGQGSVWRRFSFSDETILAVGLQKGHIKLFDCRSGQLLMELLDHKDVVRDLHFAPDESLLLVSASRDGSLKVWDLNDDGNMMKTLRGDAKWVYGCAWSPDASMLVSVGNFKSVVIWDMNLKTIARKLVGHLHDVSSCKFSPDGALLATSSFDTRVIVWDPYTGDILLQLYHLYPPPSPIFAGGSNDHYVRSLSFSPDGTHISTISEDGYVRFWDLNHIEDPVEVGNFNDGLCCTYSPDGTVVAVGSRTGSVEFFSSPQTVQSLQHYARMRIRRHVPSTKVDMLFLPLRVKEFLKYKI